MKKSNVLTIVVGGDMEKDERELFENPEKGILQPKNMIYVHSYEQLYHALSPARLDLLRYLIQHKNENCSIGKIATQLKRKREAVSRDIRSLKMIKLIQLKKEKQTIYVRTPLDSIAIEMQS